MNDETNSAKAAMRREMRRTLAAMSDAERQGASPPACHKVMGLEVFQHAATVMLYMPLTHEVDVTPIALRCFQLGKTVCVPKVDWQRRDMTAVEVTEIDDHYMEVDEHGVRSPRDARPIVRETIDVVVAPGLAFDAQGHRLGRGGGYYDRYLARLRKNATIIGLAFDRQVVDCVPALQHDMTVDVLVTDRRASFPRPSNAPR